ncbi:MAG: type Z 30S ribosomal protein S14 [Nitrospirota bacterium]|nr:type Z 30S ribosomal protein S14 [Nitrospirota bacterium]MDH5587329.1 type Z 30S ribosomal protein S14 [Nitrospirota bacterium]MDH5774300.1 type Z 30S ribosomal protein S14 [Nitrospirota bacterium]TFG64921.1 MAG: type Z 30S ribosomal protein S14 [Nitrospirales bacterium]
MSRLALKNKAKREPKFSCRQYNRCPCCGRVRGFLRRFRMCRICFRFLSLRGDIPGVTKSSW